MHEFGLVDSFMDAVLSRAGDRRVSAVKLRVGVLHRVVQESLAQAFAFSCVGTVAEGARLELVTVPVALTCRSCATVTRVAEILPDCPVCNAPSPQLTGGDELILESITFAAGSDGRSRMPLGEAVPGEPVDGHTHDEHTHDEHDSEVYPRHRQGHSGGRTRTGISPRQG